MLAASLLLLLLYQTSPAPPPASPPDPASPPEPQYYIIIRAEKNSGPLSAQFKQLQPVNSSRVWDCSSGLAPIAKLLSLNAPPQDQVS